MATIDVQPQGPGTYLVTVTDSGRSTHHEVRVGAEDLARYGGGASAEVLLVASFEFLLEREPASAILSRFDLPVIERYFPEYGRTFPGRLGK